MPFFAAEITDAGWEMRSPKERQAMRLIGTICVLLSLNRCWPEKRRAGMLLILKRVLVPTAPTPCARSLRNAELRR